MTDSVKAYVELHIVVFMRSIYIFPAVRSVNKQYIIIFDLFNHIF